MPVKFPNSSEYLMEIIQEILNLENQYSINHSLVDQIPRFIITIIMCNVPDCEY